MKKKIWILVVLIAVLMCISMILFVPIPIGELNDGGTRVYSALTYTIVEWNELDNPYETPLRKTAVYWGFFGYKRTKEFREMERQKQSNTMFAQVVKIGTDETVTLEPLWGDVARNRADRIVVNTDELSAIDVRYGDIVEVVYMGSVMESSPAQINAVSWKKVTPLHNTKFSGKWLPEKSGGEMAVPSFGSFRITQIYADCFFLQPTSDDYEYRIKVNGRLSNDFCIGDDVYGTFRNFRLNESLGRAEMDCVKLYIDLDLNAKPVIYLYPEEETEVSVKLTVDGKLTCTYPAYEDGWTVTASPDGTLTDADGKTYNYLYWEALSPTKFDFSTGFCVKGEDTAAFLEIALEQLGLNRREANEFIIYWLPLMQENEYNVISFQTDVYTDSAKLEIAPNPDTLIRVFMAWYGSDTPVDLPAQELTAPEREGFTVIEWGGSHVGD